MKNNNKLFIILAFYILIVLLTSLGVGYLFNQPKEVSECYITDMVCKQWNELQCVDGDSVLLGYDFETKACYEYCINHKWTVSE